MEIVMIYSEKIVSELIPASTRFEVLLKLPFKVIKPYAENVEDLILHVHSREYLERVKNHPFFETAVENVRCIASGVEALKHSDAVIVPITAAGHLAEAERMRGSCIFNGLAIAVKLLKSMGKVAVVETDAHHGKAAMISQGDVKFFCIGNKKCEISEDLRCVLGRSVGKGYVESLKGVVEKVKDYSPDFVVWYLGTDIDSREYAEMDVGVDDWREIAEMIAETAKGRKALIMLASGSREDVVRDVALRLYEALSG